MVRSVYSLSGSPLPAREAERARFERSWIDFVSLYPEDDMSELIYFVLIHSVKGGINILKNSLGTGNRYWAALIDTLGPTRVVHQSQHTAFWCPGPIDTPEGPYRYPFTCTCARFAQMPIQHMPVLTVQCFVMFTAERVSSSLCLGCSIILKNSLGTGNRYWAALIDTFPT